MVKLCVTGPGLRTWICTGAAGALDPRAIVTLAGTVTMPAVPPATDSATVVACSALNPSAKVSTGSGGTFGFAGRVGIDQLHQPGPRNADEGDRGGATVMLSTRWPAREEPALEIARLHRVARGEAQIDARRLPVGARRRHAETLAIEQTGRQRAGAADRASLERHPRAENTPVDQVLQQRL